MLRWINQNPGASLAGRVASISVLVDTSQKYELVPYLAYTLQNVDAMTKVSDVEHGNDQLDVRIVTNAVCQR